MRAENPLCFEGLGATQLSGEGWQQWLQFPPKEHNPFQLLMFQLFGVTDTRYPPKSYKKPFSWH